MSSVVTLLVSRIKLRKKKAEYVIEMILLLLTVILVGIFFYFGNFHFEFNLEIQGTLECIGMTVFLPSIFGIMLKPSTNIY